MHAASAIVVAAPSGEKQTLERGRDLAAKHSVEPDLVRSLLMRIIQDTKVNNRRVTNPIGRTSLLGQVR